MSLAASFAASDKASASIADGSQTGLNPTGSFTVAAFVYFLSLGTARPIIAKGSLDGGVAAGDEYSLFYSHGATTFRFRVTDSSGASTYVQSSFGTPSLNTWYFVLAQYNASTGKIGISVNGGSLVEASFTGPVRNGSNAFNVGKAIVGGTGPYYHDGYISHPRFWTRLLTATEIARQCNVVDGVPLARPYAQLTAEERVGLQGCWDDAPVGELNATAPWVDQTANANHLSFSAAYMIDATTLNGGTETLTAGTEALSNTGFETAGAGGADIWGTWSETAGDGALADETTIVQAGSHAAKVTAGASANTEITQTISVTGGQGRRFSFYARGDGTNQGQYAVYDVTNSAYIVNKTNTGVTGTAFAAVTKDYQVPATCTSVRVELWCSTVNGGICYYDTTSDKPLSPATWTKHEAGASKVQVELAAPYAGAYACRLDVDGSGSTAAISQSVMTTGRKYAWSFYGKTDASGTLHVYNPVTVGGTGNPSVTLTSSYAQYSGTDTAPAVTFGIWRRANVSGKSIWADNITLASAAIPSVAGPNMIPNIRSLGGRSFHRWYGPGVSSLGALITR